jgi:hypothetical protein
MRANRINAYPTADQAETNADAVLAFLNASYRISKGSSFTLPDVGQTYYVRAVKPRPKGEGKHWVFLTLVTQCVVCGLRFTQEKDVKQWRTSLYLTRCCPAHRGGWKTVMPDAWKTSEQIALREPRLVKEKQPRKLGVVQAAVQTARETLELLHGEVAREALVRMAVDMLVPTARRDTRRQQVLRELRRRPCETVGTSDFQGT